MFDNLVESSKHGRQNTRTGTFLLGTFIVYGIAMVAIVVGAIVYFDPAMAGMLDVQTMLAPPPPPSAPPPPAPAVVLKDIPVPEIFAPPEKPKDIPDPSTVRARPPIQPTVSMGVPGGVFGGVKGGIPGGISKGDEPPPPPPPPPRPTPEPTPKKIQNISSGVLPGLAIKKLRPTYPSIARAARASGEVLIQVLISEDGRVEDAQVISGHQLLREAALQSARQWVFRPTTLSGVPVKVQGVLTFNFIL
jgi:periplasmic protein TonB